MVSVNDVSTDMLVVSKNGYGKNQTEDYRLRTGVVRGKNYINYEKTGSLVAIKNVSDENDLMIINKSGIAIRMSIEKLVMEELLKGLN